jgi:quercetin dioxygenase-like cupin family protein
MRRRRVGAVPDGRRVRAMAFRVLPAADAHWRRSNMMGVLNTDLAAQLDATTLGARLWRLEPGQASTRHRHARQAELYLLLEGTGRVRIEGEVLTLAPLSALHVEPRTVRQVFNDTDADALWLVCGAPAEVGDTRTMSPEVLADLYPDGPRALPPELEG